MAFVDDVTTAMSRHHVMVISLHEMQSRRYGVFPHWGMYLVCVLMVGIMLAGCQRHDGGFSLGMSPAEQMSWSPDGSMIAYTRLQFANDRVVRRWIEVRSVRDGHCVTRSTGPLDSVPIWSMDGSTLFYCSGQGKTVRLMALPMAMPHTPRSLTTAGRVLISRANGCWLDPQRLLVFSASQLGQAYTPAILNIATNQLHSVALPLKTEIIYPVAAPNGQTLAGIEHIGNHRRLIVASLAEKRILLHGNDAQGAVLDLHWIDNATVCYLANSAQQSSIYRLSVANQQTNRVGSAAGFFGPMAYNSRQGLLAVDGQDTAQGPTRLYIFSVATGHRVAVSPADQECAAPCWSPDGTVLAYVQRRKSDKEYHVKFLHDPSVQWQRETR